MSTCACGNLITVGGTLCLRCSALQELGLRAGASDADIKTAYRLYVKAWHPDRFPGDEASKRAAQEKLKAINSAYDFLASPSSKQSQANRTRAGASPPQPSEPRQQSKAGAQANRQPTSPPPPPPKAVPRRDWFRIIATALILTAIGVVVFRSRPNQDRSASDSAPILSSPVQPKNEANGTVRVPRGFTLDAISLPNGTELRKRRRLNGLGELSVENGTASDAVVHLVDLNSGKAIRTFYVKAGNTFTERQISPGLYGVYFATGIDWNAELKTFNSDASYSQFGKNLDFSEKPDTETGKIEYSTFQITLQPVRGGNVETHPTDKNAFEKFMSDGTID